jgi:hypothetical protein
MRHIKNTLCHSKLCVRGGAGRWGDRGCEDGLTSRFFADGRGEVVHTASGAWHHVTCTARIRNRLAVSSPTCFTTQMPGEAPTATRRPRAVAPRPGVPTASFIPLFQRAVQGAHRTARRCGRRKPPRGDLTYRARARSGTWGVRRPMWTRGYAHAHLRR